MSISEPYGPVPLIICCGFSEMEQAWIKVSSKSRNKVLYLFPRKIENLIKKNNFN